MKISNNFFILPLIFGIIGTPLAFADVEFVGVDIFCPLEELLGFTGLVPFLEICPINNTIAEDLELTNLTPVQVVFNPQKLVDSKTTLLKLDIKNTFAASKTIQVTLEYDGTTPGTTITKIETINVSQGDSTHFLPSNDFIFPTGADFTATAQLETIAGETSTTNNFKSFTIPVQDTRGLGILYTPVHLIFDPMTFPGCPQMIPFADNSEAYVAGAYPINQAEYFGLTNCFIPFPVFPNSGSQIDNMGLMGLFNGLEVFTAFPGIDKTVGVLRDEWFNENFDHTDQDRTGTEGLAGVGAQVFDSVLIEVDNNLGQVTAHEIYHTYFNSPHFVETPNGYWVDNRCEMGFFDTNDSTCLDEEVAVNFMRADLSAFRNNGQVDGVIRAWVAEGQFDPLLEEFAEGIFDPPVLSIRGIISDDGATQLDTWYQFDGVLDAQLGDTGEISVVYLDENEQILGETGFNLLRQFENDPNPLDFGGFSLAIPDLPGTQKIILNRGTEQLAEQVFSDNSPSVTVLSPNGDELFVHGQPLTVSWDSADSDGEQLSHIVLISQDAGQTWIPLQLDVDGNQIDLQVPSNIISDSVLVRIISSDGVNTSEDVSDATFSIQEFQGELDCSTAVPSSHTLWPPNHKMVEITIEGITKANGSPITSTITSIFQDEPTSGKGGDKSPDGDGIGTDTASLRSERLGSSDGRVYHVFFDATDDLGATCSGEVLVSVPHDQGGDPAIDGGALFDSTL